jgi:hypothetical protein
VCVVCVAGILLSHIIEVLQAWAHSKTANARRLAALGRQQFAGLLHSCLDWWEDLINIHTYKQHQLGKLQFVYARMHSSGSMHALHDWQDMARFVWLHTQGATAAEKQFWPGCTCQSCSVL